MAYTNIDDPSAYFQAKAYTGNGSNGYAITNDGNSNLQPDLWWVKNRDKAYDHNLYDSTRGTSLRLVSNGTQAEATATDRIASFDTNGFTLNGSVISNENNNPHVAWQWKANVGTTATNSDGSMTSTVQVNQDAGFSIVTWTTGVGSGNHSVGHGLGVKPAMFITKSRGGTSSWWTWHQGLTGDTSYVNLQATTAEATFSDIWGDGITSSVFGYNYPATVYANQPYIAYCFAEKQGYSKFGKYVGNGNADGPFVYTGFKPAFVILKGSSASGSWYMLDSKRDVDNVAHHAVEAQSAAAEYTNYNFIDMLSNGFKLRLGTSEVNTSGNSYIYMAFAENPFVTSTGIPTTAR